MSEQLPRNPYRCVNCKRLCEKPHLSCPDCGKTGAVAVRENLEEADTKEPTIAEDDSYRCVDCGHLSRRPYKECPECGSRTMGSRGQRAPPSNHFMEMMMGW